MSRLIDVSLGKRSYQVAIDTPADFQAVLQQIASKGYSAYHVVTNTTLQTVGAIYLAAVQRELNATQTILPDGEKHKTLQSWQNILDDILQQTYDRRLCLIALGGGVVGDITGFAAASFLRGVAFVQIPTTLLAMVDSSVGGKTGVNHACGKNLIGAFHQPDAVYIHTPLLQTLPQREFISGYAEVFKCAFFGGEQMLEFIEDNHEAICARKQEAVLEAIARAVSIKASIVSEDEREAGARALLNYGHTFGHALEKVSGYGPVLHGEAVFWGMHCALSLAAKLQLIDSTVQQRYANLLARSLRPAIDPGYRTDKLVEAMFSDKKTRSGKLRLVLPVALARAAVIEDVDPDLVAWAIDQNR